VSGPQAVLSRAVIFIDGNNWYHFAARSRFGRRRSAGLRRGFPEADRPKVYAASPAPGAKLAAEVSSYIRLRRDWFDDCFRP